MDFKKDIIRNSTVFLAVSSIFSQILGFVRDKLLSHIYGAGFFLDSYYAAFRVPEFMYLSIGSFVSSAILVPLFSKKLYDEDRVIYFQKLCTTFIVFFVVTYGIVILFLPKIINILYGHMDPLFQKSIVLYGSILLVSTFFLSLSSVISSVAQQKRKFIYVGIAPILYNLGTVIGIVVLRPYWGVVGVCIGVVLGSLLHLLVQLPIVIRLGLFENYGKFILKSFSFSLLKNTLSKSFLRTLSLIFSAVTFFLLTYFASRYEVGSITVISLAFTLQTVFHTILGVSYATTIFPLLSDAFVAEDDLLFDSIIANGFKKIFLISIVFTALVVLFRFEIVHILFGSGNFTNRDVVLTAAALGIFIISLYAQNAILLISRASYAKGDYVLPLVTNIMSAILFFIFAILLSISKFDLYYNVLSVPIAYSLSQYIALGVAFIIYRKNKIVKSPYLGLSYMFKISITTLITVISCRYILYIMLMGQSSIFLHILYSFFVFVFFIFSTYVLLGLFKDINIIENRIEAKNLFNKISLALWR